MKKMMMILALLFAMVGSSFGTDVITATNADFVIGKIDKITLRYKTQVSNSSNPELFQHYIVYLKDISVEGSGTPIAISSKAGGNFLFKGDDQAMLAALLSAKNAGIPVKITITSSDVVTYNSMAWNKIVNLSL